MKNDNCRDALVMRPYQLMHIVARIGAGRGISSTDDLGHARLSEILAAVRRAPNTPVTLICNTSSPYYYQNPGPGEDTSDGRLFNLRRDLKILQMLGLVPGDTRPALELFTRLFENVPTARDILWFDEQTSSAWKGEPRESCRYDEGHRMGLQAVIPGRPVEEKKAAKQESVEALRKAGVLGIRPHHLMCMACYYRGPDDLSPIAEDNIFEVIDLMQKNPQVAVELVEGPCMVCPPCHAYDPELNKCIGDVGIGLRDELKDLYVLQRLGLSYGDVRPAEQLYQALFDRISATPEICGFGQTGFKAREWRPCGGDGGKVSYVASRLSGMGIVPPRDR